MPQYLVVIDMQNDFVTGSLGTVEAQAIVPNVVCHVREAIDAKQTVLFTQDTHQDATYLQTTEGAHLPIKHTLLGTEGWQIIPQLLPYATHTVTKPTFGSVRLVEMLREASQAPDGKDLNIALCGVCTDICVVSNALLLRAHFPEATLRAYRDACAGSTPEKHDAALAVMQSCHVDIV